MTQDAATVPYTYQFWCAVHGWCIPAADVFGCSTCAAPAPGEEG